MNISKFVSTWSKNLNLTNKLNKSPHIKNIHTVPLFHQQAGSLWHGPWRISIAAAWMDRSLCQLIVYTCPVLVTYMRWSTVTYMCWSTVTYMRWSTVTYMRWPTVTYMCWPTVTYVLVNYKGTITKYCLHINRKMWKRLLLNNILWYPHFIDNVTATNINYGVSFYLHNTITNVCQIFYSNSNILSSTETIRLDWIVRQNN